MNLFWTLCLGGVLACLYQLALARMRTFHQKYSKDLRQLVQQLNEKARHLDKAREVR